MLPLTQQKNQDFNMEWERADERAEMVQTQIRSRGISDQRVLRAMEIVPRHLFTPLDQSSLAYSDHPLPIGYGQTISQPYIVARMTELLHPQPGDTILEIGTGSGYQAAIMATIGARVISLERIPAVADAARANLKKAQITDVTVHLSDGTIGWTEGAPYNGILITAAAPSVPPPLLSQLVPNGRLVAPVGSADLQVLLRLTRREENIEEERFESVRFVPLIGKFGWTDNSSA